jgi:UDP-GlcNAc:undecaprenyl-phosphate GlcNAc-1-phosphate transferase
MFEILLISAGIISFIICVASIPVLIRLSIKKHWFDEIDERKLHTGNISRLAGVAVFYSMLIGLVIGLALLNRQTNIMSNVSFKRLLTFIVAFFLVQMIGLIDDFRSIRPRYKFAVQIIATIMIIIPDKTLSLLYIPFFQVTLNIGVFGYILTGIWIIGGCNAVNLIDGMDGLSGGITAIAALFLSLIAIALGNYITAVISFALFGSLIGFLVFNFPPAKIFMGDSGALFLGFALASLPLLEINYHSDMTLIISVSILCIPVIDTLTSILRRLKRKQSPFHPDREHIHHKLIDRNFTTKQILFTIYTVSIIICLPVFLWAATGNKLFINITMIIWAVLIVLSLVLEKHQADNN